MNSNTLIYTLLNMDGWGPNTVFSYVKENNFDYESCRLNLVNILSNREQEIFKNKLFESTKICDLNLKNGIECISILDPRFPKKLYNTSDKCVFLFFKGNIDLLSKKSISIIGTRKPEESFIEKGKNVTEYFAKKDYVIVSGLALGCDTIAHQSCIDVNGKTIAVLPSSCDNVQPSSNRELANNILKNDGLLISEYSFGSKVSKYNFPRRDRIQSLLSSVVLIIQASDDSGTMIATKKSLKDGKFVYAIKGNNLTLVNRYVDVDDISDLEEVETWIL